MEHIDLVRPPLDSVQSNYLIRLVEQLQYVIDQTSEEIQALNRKLEEREEPRHGK